MPTRFGHSLLFRRSARLKEDRTWRTAPGFSGYEFSSLGEVRNQKTGRVLQLSITASGYQYVTVNGLQMGVHRPVCIAFHGHPPHR